MTSNVLSHYHDYVTIIKSIITHYQIVLILDLQVSFRLAAVLLPMIISTLVTFYCCSQDSYQVIAHNVHKTPGSFTERLERSERSQKRRKEFL